MKKIILICLTFTTIYSCCLIKKSTSYYFYTTDEVKIDSINEFLEVIHYTKTNKRKSKRYFSQAICIRVTTNDTIRVINWKKNNDFRKNDFIIFLPIDNSFDTLYCAFDSISLKYKSKYLTYFGAMYPILPE